MAKVTTPANQLKKQLHSMHQLQFQDYIHDILQHLMKTYCPNRVAATEIFLLDESDTFGREKLGGVSAFIDYGGKQTFIVYPEEKVRPILEATVIHEFHHFWRMGLLHITEENETLLDKLVLEGLAEYFVGQLLGSERQGPFINALTEEQAKELWTSTYQNQLHLKGEETNLLLFGGEEKGLPLWAGYSMGFHLVQWFINSRPDFTIEEITAIPAKAFI